VGPQPNGIIQQEFQDTLKLIGKWMEKYGESIYRTRANLMPPQDWGVVTSKGKKIFVHILKDSAQPIIVEGIKDKIKSCQLMGQNQPIKFKQHKNQVTLNLEGLSLIEPDTIIEIETK
jgi:alpha-L-fucosidase